MKFPPDMEDEKDQEKSEKAVWLELTEDDKFFIQANWFDSQKNVKIPKQLQDALLN